MADCDFDDGDGVWGVFGGVFDGEGGCGALGDGVGGGVARCWVYFVESVIAGLTIVLMRITNAKARPSMQPRGSYSLLAKKIPEVSDSIPWVANKLCFCLRAMELFALDVG